MDKPKPKLSTLAQDAALRALFSAIEDGSLPLGEPQKPRHFKTKWHSREQAAKLTAKPIPPQLPDIRDCADILPFTKPPGRSTIPAGLLEPFFTVMLAAHFNTPAGEVLEAAAKCLATLAAHAERPDRKSRRVVIEGLGEVEAALMTVMQKLRSD